MTWDLTTYFPSFNGPEMLRFKEELRAGRSLRSQLMVLTGLLLALSILVTSFVAISVLRTSLLPGLVGAVAVNARHRNTGVALFEMLNPMHRLWSDGRWNKLTVAHGCYWKKCSFCDVSLDYISRYENATATELVNRIEAIVAETGQTGFHFVDEAAPPKALKALALELIERNVSISWWGNIRFEKSFTPELCQLLADSGCIAVSGGLEVASDRLLNLMKKGVSVEQVARVTKGFTDAGVLVHAYLMYGFPTQTVQDTVDALEYVRQLFAEGCIQSGYFHRFACTVHSPVGKNPEEYGIQLKPLPQGTFAKNDIGFTDPTGVDHAALGEGLNRALYNYMHGIGLDEDTAVLVNSDDVLDVVGRGAALIVDGSHIETDAFRVKRYDPLMVSGAILHSLPEGSRFDLRLRTLVSAPPRDDRFLAAEDL